MAPMPKHLTGDKAAINAFIDKFDVSDLILLRLKKEGLT